MLSDLFKLVMGNFKSRRLRSWLTMMGIFIGIAAVVSLISLGEGLTNVVTSQFDLLQAEVLTIQAGGNTMGPPGAGVVNPLTKDDLEAVRRVKGVEYAFARIIETEAVEFNNKIQYSYLGSIPEGKDGETVLDLLGYEVDEGRLLMAGDNMKVTVGHDFSDDKKFGKPVMIGSNIIVNGDQYEVVGIIKKKGSFIIDNTIIFTENNLRETAGDASSEHYDAMMAKAQKGVPLDEVKEGVEKALRNSRNVDVGEEDFSVDTNKSILKTLESALFGVKLFVYIIAGISLIVGGIGIANTMYTSVLERRSQIGIMKAIGATNKNIFTMFFLEAGLLGTVGGIIGIVLGASLAKGLAFIGSTVLGTDILNAHITLWLIVGSLLFSFVIGTVFGLLPAIKASKLNPVDALRD